MVLSASCLPCECLTWSYPCLLRDIPSSAYSVGYFLQKHINDPNIKELQVNKFLASEQTDTFVGMKFKQGIICTVLAMMGYFTQHNGSKVRHELCHFARSTYLVGPQSSPRPHAAHC